MLGNERNVQRALRVIQKRYPDVDTTSVDQLGIPGVAAGLTLSSDRMQVNLQIYLFNHVRHSETSGYSSPKAFLSIFWTESFHQFT